VSKNINRYIIWYYKAFLTGQIGGATLGLGTVAGSSDGLTGAMDGVDRWGSTFDMRKLPCNSNGTLHAWVVLKSPLITGGDGSTRYYYLFITFNGGSNETYTTVMKLGVDTGAPGSGVPTGGSAVNDPTIVNFCLPQYSGSFNFGLTIANGGPIRLHGALATDGSFNVFVSRNGRGVISGCHGHVLVNVKATDAYPFWFNCTGTGGTQSGGVIGTWGTTTSSDGLADGTRGMMRVPNGTGYDTYGAIMPLASNFEGGMDAFDGTYSELPIWVGKDFSGVNSYYGVRGRLADITVFPGNNYATSPRQVQDGTPDNQGTPKYFNVGLYRFPANALVRFT
jgi:hypothetical protein